TRCVETLFKTTRPEFITQTFFVELPPLGAGHGAKALLEHGADAKLTDGEGRTMLVRAAASDDQLTDAMRMLIAKDVDVNAKAKTGETAMGHARLRGQTPVAELLRSAGGRLPDAENTPTRRPSPAASPR